MRNLIKAVAVLALLGCRATIAQTAGTARSSTSSVAATAPLLATDDTRLVPAAPIGHRQVHARDVPSESPADFERLSVEDAAVDRKLNICRGC